MENIIAKLKILKKCFYLFLLPLCFGCSSDENTEVNYNIELVGDYKLMSMQSNLEVDLNLDGYAQKNVMEEVDCMYHDSFVFFDFQIRVNGNYNYIKSKVIHSYSVRYEQPPYEYQCFSSESMPYDFDYNPTKNIEILNRDFISERENEYGKLLSINYVESQKEITTKVEKEIYTAEGWQTIIITSVYKNIYDDNFAPQ